MPGNIARVTVNLSLDRLFDYRIPESLSGEIFPGMKVNVPFGKGGFRQAYVITVTDASGRKDLKEIESVCSGFPRIPDALLKLSDWMADYYCCPRELTVRNLLPGAIRSGKIKAKTREHCRIVDHLASAEFIEKNETGRLKTRASLLKILMLERELPTDILLLKSGVGKSVLDGLVKAGLVEKIREEVDRDPFKGMDVIPTKAKIPTPEQSAALEIIRDVIDGKRQQHTVLLHGVTCSGKTEVYLQSIEYAISHGGSAIVLVPEISLTPQTVERFRARFGNMVSVLHSGLSDGERRDEWMKVHQGRVRIAVGARSALFAPFTDLKLIIVDEEHEQSYKQSEAPRYNARDVAVMRGKLEKAAVILGSATPSVESHHNALCGKYAHAVMLHRTDPNIRLPDVRIIDMRSQDDGEGHIPFLSKELVDAVHERLEKGEQSILFLNRRGFAKQLKCDQSDCKFIAECPDCGVPYTYHKKLKILTCHLCGAMVKAPERCPDCGSPEIKFSGAGTERIENISFAAFKNARIGRMDSDTMTRPELYEEILSSFRNGKIDILVGTQMIAKGLDFPNVTLVGVINADMGLFIDDFRATERTFQLLTQVAGRAGRGDMRGDVIFQTCTPYNAAIQAAANHDCQAFYEEELPVREALSLPPYGHVIVLRFIGEDPGVLQNYAEELLRKVQPYLSPETNVSEPAPCPIERMKGKYRYMIMFRGGNLSYLKKFLRYELYRNPVRGITVQTDVDPMSLM